MATRTGPAILLIRHGETEWSRSGQHTGTTDLPLTADGERRAAALRERIGERRYALVATSPLQRARRTCELAGLSDRAEVIDDLRELDYGSYEGRRTVDIRKERPGWNIWRDGTPGGEELDDAGARADRIVERALAAGGDVALFGHGHFLRVVGARWIGLAAQAGSGLALGTAALCDLGFERERRVIWLWNDTR